MPLFLLYFLQNIAFFIWVKILHQKDNFLLGYTISNRQAFFSDKNYVCYQSHSVFLPVISALKVSYGYAGKNRRSRKGIIIVKYLRKMKVYHETERDSAWFGTRGGGWCTLWVWLVPCLRCQKSLGQPCAVAPFCFEIAARTVVPTLHPSAPWAGVPGSVSAEKYAHWITPQATETLTGIGGLGYSWGKT